MTVKTKTMCCIIGSRSLAGLAVCTKWLPCSNQTASDKGAPSFTALDAGDVRPRGHEETSVSTAGKHGVHADALDAVDALRRKETFWSSPASDHRSDQ